MADCHTLRSRAPSIKAEDFRIAVGLFRFWLREQDSPTAAQLRDEAERLGDLADRMAEVLGGCSDGLSDLLVLRGLQSGVSRSELRASLGKFADAAEMARRDAEALVGRGRSIAPTTRLVWRLADLIEQGGGEVDAKPNGELVQAFSIALDVAGRSLAAPRDTVRAALDKRCE